MLRDVAAHLAGRMPHFMDLDDLVSAGWLAYARAWARDQTKARANAVWAMKTELLTWYGAQRDRRTGKWLTPRWFGFDLTGDPPVPADDTTVERVQRTREEAQWQLVNAAIGRLPQKEAAAIRLWLARAPNSAKALRVPGPGGSLRARRLHLAALRRLTGKAKDSRLGALRYVAIRRLQKMLQAACKQCGSTFVPGWASSATRHGSKRREFCSKTCSNRHNAAHRPRTLARQQAMGPRPCLVCATSFAPKKEAAARFCSRRCSRRWQLGNVRAAS
jgi:hypothetical protein